MKSHSARLGLGIVAVAMLLLPAWVCAQQGLSHVRVVRLSYVSGTVGVKRLGSTEATKAMVNTPIQEGFEVETAENSYAEVEFENGSSARLGQLTSATFTQLALDADGNKLNRVKIDKGYATFHFMPEHQDVYSVTVADATLSPSGKSTFRTDFDGGQARLKVMAGSVEVAAGAVTQRVGKDQVLQFAPGVQEADLKVQHGITKDDWDKWTEERDKQQQLALRDQAMSAPSGAVYGWSDLDFYGEWAMIPGYGYGWAPYVAAGWSPFTMGMWDMYPGFGLTWISSEPWGWLPYHYGLWNFDPMFGWFWMPGGFNYWSPALVTWYSGPGWTGWAPHGVGPRATRPITAVAGGVVRTGVMLTPQDTQRQSLTGSAILKAQPANAAGAQTAFPRMGVVAGTALRGAASFQTRVTPAPATVLMGGDAAAERSLLGRQPSALGRAFGVSHTETLRVRGGTTLGGTYAVRGSTGEFRGDIFRGPERGPAMKGMNGPAVSGRSGGGYGRATVMAHGQASAPSSGSAGVHSSGGGYSGGGAVSSVSSSSSISSSGHAASSTGGGGHR